MFPVNLHEVSVKLRIPNAKINLPAFATVCLKSVQLSHLMINFIFRTVF